ncbi:Mth938-like domain-containing protein [Aromatoleum petrolei]|uniref:Xcc1710-like domain-containing protein n=1 Tax=Aromatoleum petrolei TaxID=76116 RepID=A0ABX1MNU3_9RHOO|nr:Mth938-like domain-containing protein [Aromatoleum petrolei]NMF88303.1 hypothetical protein [Aromatoleum petrolei]QTQ37999.1 putative protein DUF498 [Aromatoleum petrolei]
MKLNLQQTADLNVLTGYGTDHLMINKERHDGNALVAADRIVAGWAPGGFDALSADDFAMVCEMRPEVVLIGTGSRQRFPAPQVLRPLIEARIGFEIMDLPAACRTYNILAAEGRSVVAALLFDPT